MNSKDGSTMIWTPTGLEPITKVHEVPSGSFINSQNNQTDVIYSGKVILTEIDEKSSDKTSVTNTLNSDWKPQYIEGVEYTPGQTVGEYNVNFTVPNRPTNSRSNEIISIWPGIHQATGYNGLIQSVLSWNELGDQRFIAAAWVVTDNGWYESTYIPTRPNDLINSTMTYSSSDLLWTIRVRDLTNNGVTSLITNVVSPSSCQIALMLEGSSNCDQTYLPGYTIFSNLSLKSNTGADITPIGSQTTVRIADTWKTLCPGLDVYNNGWPNHVLLKTGNSVPLAIPPGTALPRDLNGDRLYEDSNGNGVFNFDDVYYLFVGLEWVMANEPVDIFDFDKSGQFDFGDVIKLNQMLGG